MAATQTPAVGDGRGSTLPTAGHQEDAFLAEMNRQARAGIANLDNIGTGRMEYDGPRCADDDCTTPVEDDGDRCEDCAGRCTECGREISRPGQCFDCAVESSYVGGLAPRFGAQP